LDKSQCKRMATILTFVVEKLANGQLSELLEASLASSLSVADLSTAIFEYGIDIDQYAPITDADITVYEVANSNPPTWNIDYELVDRRHGPSDLTLQLTVIENQGPRMAFEIDDLHVL